MQTGVCWESLDELLEEYCDWLVARKANSPSSVAWKRYILRKMLVDVAGGDPLNFRQILWFIRSLAIDTQRTYLYVVRQFYKWLAERCRVYGEEKIARRIEAFTEDLRAPRGKNTPEWLTRDEVKELLKYAREEKDPRKYAVIQFLLSTGLRISEFLSLKRDDFRKDGETYVFKVKGKGNRERKLRISADLLKLLEESGWFEKPVTRRTVHRWISSIGKKLGLNVHPHTLRHTFAHMLVEEGEDLPMIQALLGHASLATTGRYLQEDPSRFTLNKKEQP